MRGLSSFLCPQVKLAYQESEVAALLKKIPLGPSEMSTMRCRAEELREGTLCDYRPVLPLMLASFIFDVLCAPGTVADSTASGEPGQGWLSLGKIQEPQGSELPRTHQAASWEDL